MVEDHDSQIPSSPKEAPSNPHPISCHYMVTVKIDHIASRDSDGQTWCMRFREMERKNQIEIVYTSGSTTMLIRIEESAGCRGRLVSRLREEFTYLDFVKTRDSSETP